MGYREDVVTKLQKDELFRAVSESLPLALFITDTKGDCIYVNRVYEEISGVVIDDALGRGWIKGIHPDDRDKVVADWYVYAKNSKRGDGIYRFQRKDGKITWAHVTISIIQNGHPLGYLGIVEDITEWRRKENELQNYAESLQKMNGVFIDRELKMIELKEKLDCAQKKIHELEERLAQK